MNIDISKIVADKLAQLDNDGIIKRKVEETIEKSVSDAITSELGSYRFKSIITEQLAQSVSEVIKDIGLSGYNGYIAQAVKAILTDMQSQDIAEKVQAALNDIVLKKYENIALSEIFTRYREWVNENVDDDEKQDREMFTASIEVRKEALFTYYVCRFADHQLDGYLSYREDPDVELRFCVHRNETTSRIGSVYLDGHSLQDTLRIGYLSEFEAFVTNLYYNGTKIIIDPENVEDDCRFEIDED